MGAQTWVKVTSTSVSSTKYTISDISEEASYQFRISAVNDFGQSAYLEVPGTFYLGEKDFFVVVVVVVDGLHI